jgi:CRP-like cAMP-binding protein
MTWRTVQLTTENGDLDIIPNRAIAQAVVTNLYAPSGLHRRTAKVIVEPHPELHRGVAALAQALGGIPHLPARRPEVVTHSLDQGGVVLEMRWWALGFRHGRAGTYQAVGLAGSVLPRLGFQIMGPHGPSRVEPGPRELDEATLQQLLLQFNLPLHWAPELRLQVRRRVAAPGEGILREGDPGQSLFAVLRGRLDVVKVVEGTAPYTGLFWETRAVLEAGAWFGEASLLTGATCNATVVAATDCELAELPKEAFETCIRREPQVLERLVDIMEARARSQEPLVPEGREQHREQWLRQIRSWFRV